MRRVHPVLKPAEPLVVRDGLLLVVHEISGGVRNVDVPGARAAQDEPTGAYVRRAVRETLGIEVEVKDGKALRGPNGFRGAVACLVRGEPSLKNTERHDFFEWCDAGRLRRHRKAGVLSERLTALMGELEKLLAPGR